MVCGTQPRCQCPHGGTQHSPCTPRPHLPLDGRGHFVALLHHTLEDRVAQACRDMETVRGHMDGEGLCRWGDPHPTHTHGLEASRFLLLVLRPHHCLRVLGSVIIPVLSSGKGRQRGHGKLGMGEGCVTMWGCSERGLCHGDSRAAVTAGWDASVTEGYLGQAHVGTGDTGTRRHHQHVGTRRWEHGQTRSGHAGPVPRAQKAHTGRGPRVGVASPTPSPRLPTVAARRCSPAPFGPRRLRALGGAMAVGRKPEVAPRRRPEGAGTSGSESAGLCVRRCPRARRAALRPSSERLPATNNDRCRADAAFIRSSSNDFQKAQLKNSRL